MLKLLAVPAPVPPVSDPEPVQPEMLKAWWLIAVRLVEAAADEPFTAPHHSAKPVTGQGENAMVPVPEKIFTTGAEIPAANVTVTPVEGDRTAPSPKVTNDEIVRFDAIL